MAANAQPTWPPPTPTSGVCPQPELLMSIYKFLRKKVLMGSGQWPTVARRKSIYCWVSSLWVGTLAPERERWDQAGPLWPAPTLLCSASCPCVQCKTVLERRFRRLRQEPWGQSRGTDPPLTGLEAGLERQSRGCAFGADQSAWLEQTCCPDDLSSHVAKGGVSSDEGGRSCSEQD